jgi:hypothetical protein
MAHYAKIEDQLVVSVIVLDEENELNANEFLLNFGLGQGWLKTSYNTRGGVHYGPDGEPDNGVPLRYNYAGVGFTYDEVRDAFIPPSPYPSWVLNEETCLWDAPVPKPAGDWDWDEDSGSWVQL